MLPIPLQINILPQLKPHLAVNHAVHGVRALEVAGPALGVGSGGDEVDDFARVAFAAAAWVRADVDEVLGGDCRVS